MIFSLFWVFLFCLPSFPVSQHLIFFFFFFFFFKSSLSLLPFFTTSLIPENLLLPFISFQKGKGEAMSRSIRQISPWRSWKIAKSCLHPLLLCCCLHFQSLVCTLHERDRDGRKLHCHWFGIVGGQVSILDSDTF